MLGGTLFNVLNMLWCSCYEEKNVNFYFLFIEKNSERSSEAKNFEVWHHSPLTGGKQPDCRQDFYKHKLRSHLRKGILSAVSFVCILRNLWDLVRLVDLSIAGQVSHDFIQSPMAVRRFGIYILNVMFATYARN